MLAFDPTDTYWNCVCLLLPDRMATLVDVDTFERFGHFDWRVLGDTVFRMERYTVVTNPTARPRNRRERVRYRFESLARLVLKVPYDRQADHRNRVRLDNRRDNLRVATASQNMMNKKGIANKSSRFKGVHWNKRSSRWTARTTFEGNTYHLGNFTDETAAALAYNAFVIAHCPEFGYLNPISGATRDDEPTVAARPPKKRRSKLIKLTLTERRIRKIRASIIRSTRTEKRRRQIEAEILATRKPWEPGDPTLTAGFCVRLRSPRPAGSLTHFAPPIEPAK